MTIDLAQAMAQTPLVAILRGIKPQESVAIGQVLVEEGFSIIEVPLNSPQPLASIEAMTKALGDRVLIGAGTVLGTEQVTQVASAGGRLVVSPDAKVEVVQATRAAGLYSIPGFATVSEAFAMIDAGADALKLFPAEASSPQVLKAMRAVLPAQVPVLPVGGIDSQTMSAWREAGAAGFGLGSAIYRTGDSADVVRKKARSLLAAW